MKKRDRVSLLIFLFPALLCSCAGNRHSGNATHSDSRIKNTDTVHLKFKVEAAPQWTALFNRPAGWFGGDGIFSIPCNGVDTAGGTDSTLLLFSDTMIGDIKDGKIQRGASMVHNTVAYLTGSRPLAEHIKFYWNKNEKGKPVSLFTPRTPASSDSDYYWLGDGFVNASLNNNTYIFAYRIRNVSKKDFGFREVGNVLIVLPAGSKPPFKDQRQMDTPFFLPGNANSGSGSFGAGIFVNTKKAGAPHPDGYVYVYGVRGAHKNVMVARVHPKKFEDFSRWRFWDGKGWNADIRKVANITDRASNELSLTPLPDGRYALIFQTDGMSSSVGLRLGLSPTGPFGPVIQLWKCPEVGENKHYFTYNAKAHPNLSEPGELLISYNVNSFDFFNQIKINPNLYRPRFIKIRFQ